MKDSGTKIHIRTIIIDYKDVTVFVNKVNKDKEATTTSNTLASFTYRVLRVEEKIHHIVETNESLGQIDDESWIETFY